MRKNFVKLRTSVLVATFGLCVLMLGLYISLYFQHDIESMSLVFPSSDTGTYNSLITNKDGEIILLVKEQAAGKWLFTKEGSKVFEKISLPLETKEICSRISYDMYENAPDGRLQFRKICYGQGYSIASLVLYNLKSGESYEILGTIPLGIANISWNPEQTKAVGYLDNNFSSGTLFWLWKEGYESMDLTISEGNRSWNLKDDFPKFTNSKSGTTGNAVRATWSPDGKLITFFASTEAIGLTGFDRFRVSYHLYLMDSALLKPYLVQTDIFHPHIMKWSPNSRYIAFIGFSGSLKQNGLWLYSLDTNSVSLISKGSFRDLTWRESNSIVALQCEDVLVCNQVEEFNLSDYIPKQ